MTVTEHSKPAEIVDGVLRYPRSGLRVIIVGGGVGGLQAALECWRKGHEVQVVERMEHLSPHGDYFTITPSGLSTLDNYPKMLAAYKENFHDNVIQWYSTDGKKYFEREAEWHKGKPHAAGDMRISFLKRRAAFAQMQYDQAQRLGIPVFFGRKVISYEEDILSNEARIQCASGEAFAADIIIAADGIGSKSHGVVTGQDARVYPTGYAIARVAYGREHIKSGSLAEKLLPQISQRPEFRVYVGPNLHFILFLNHDGVGFAHTHHDTSASAQESWHNFITPSQMMDTLGLETETWDPALVDLIRQIPKDTRVVDWKLSWRDPNPAWASPGGRIIQVGDAAHSFLPTSGNGATQALEDAFSIAECLRLGGKDLAAWSTKVHQRLRYERVTMIQKTGFVNRELVHRAWVELRDGGEEGIERGQNEYYKQGQWMWGHKSEEYAAQNYWDALDSLRGGKPFNNTNLAEGMKFEPWTIEGVLAEEKAKADAVLGKSAGQ